MEFVWLPWAPVDLGARMAEETTVATTQPQGSSGSQTISLGPFGQQNPWLVVLLAVLGVGGGSTAATKAFGIDTSEFARVEDVRRIEDKVDRIDGKLDEATDKMIELRVLIATLTGGTESDI